MVQLSLLASSALAVLPLLTSALPQPPPPPNSPPAAPPSQTGSDTPPVKCRNPVVRKEWRTLTHDQQQSYLKAVNCVLNKPALTPYFPNSGVISRYDDLVYTHIQQTFSIHYNGVFLSWHRYFTSVLEYMLRTECGFNEPAGNGAFLGQPYWAWEEDVTPSSKFTSNPMWAPDAFGGNGPYVAGNASDPFAVPGRTGGGCVTDGAFQNMTVHLGPQSSVTRNDQCLKRDFSPYFSGRYLGLNQTMLTMTAQNYGDFDQLVEGGPSFDASGIHGGGHYGIGGEFGQMGDLYVSPADPSFFMHHANLDRVWWSWQSIDFNDRLNQVTGPIALMDYTNAQGGNVTLDFPISVGVSAPNVTIGDVTNILGGGGQGRVCYTYDTLYPNPATRPGPGGMPSSPSPPPPPPKSPAPPSPPPPPPPPKGPAPPPAGPAPHSHP